MNRRGFLGALAALVGAAIVRPEPESEWTIERSFIPRDEAERIYLAPDINPRRVPPGCIFFIDARSLRRIRLRDDDYIVWANGAPKRNALLRLS